MRVAIVKQVFVKFERAVTKTASLGTWSSCVEPYTFYDQEWKSSKFLRFAWTDASKADSGIDILIGFFCRFPSPVSKTRCTIGQMIWVLLLDVLKRFRYHSRKLSSLTGSYLIHRTTLCYNKDLRKPCFSLSLGRLCWHLSRDFQSKSSAWPVQHYSEIPSPMCTMRFRSSAAMLLLSHIFQMSPFFCRPDGRDL